MLSFENVNYFLADPLHLPAIRGGPVLWASIAKKVFVPHSHRDRQKERGCMFSCSQNVGEVPFRQCFFKCRWLARHQDEVHVHLQVRRGWMGKGFYFRIENIKGKTEWVKKKSLHSLSRATWRGTRSTTSSAPGTNLLLGRAMWESKKMKWGGNFEKLIFFVDSRCGNWTCGESCSEQRRGHCALGRKKIMFLQKKINVCQM